MRETEKEGARLSEDERRERESAADVAAAARNEDITRADIW